MNRRALYQRAYELAYMSLMNARLSRSVAKIAFGQLDAALDQQFRRSYYNLRKVRAQELREVDIIDPHGLALEVSRADTSLTKYLTDKFIKPDTAAVVKKFLNTHSERVLLRQKLTRDLNEAIVFGYLPVSEEMLSRLTNMRREEYRASKQIINRHIIQKAFKQHLATDQHRNVVSLTEAQTIQLLVYSASERYELEAEDAGDTSYQDLCIRYFKYLAKLSFKANVFHTAVAYGSLIYDYGRTGAKKIYEYAVQDPNRFRPETNFSNLKASIMGLLEKERFSTKYRLVKQHEIGGRSGFRNRTSSATDVDRSVSWLMRLALWLECIHPTEVKSSSPDEGWRNKLTFVGNDPDDEHLVEQRRIHAISCPRCFALLSARAGLTDAREHLNIPHFETTVEMKNDSDDNSRLNPPPMDLQEVNDDLKELDGLRALRRISTPTVLSCRIDAIERAQLVFNSKMNVSFTIKGSPDILEIWGAGEHAGAKEILLAVHFLPNSVELNRTEVFSLGLANNALNIELTRGLENALGVAILWQQLPFTYTEYCRVTNCLDQHRLAELAIDPALSTVYENEHINDCGVCNGRLNRLTEEIHPTIATLLAFIVGVLGATSQSFVEEHLRTGCRRCALALRARSFVATVSELQTHELTLNQLREFLRYSISGIDRIPGSVREYSGVRAERPSSYFRQFAQQEIIVTIEEAAEAEWIITVASRNRELEGRSYSVEIIGEQSVLVANVTLKKEGDFYEGSSYIHLPDGFIIQADTYALFGTISSPESIRNADASDQMSDTELMNVLKVLAELK